jgi:Sec-independent protein translocase protein TatA
LGFGAEILFILLLGLLVLGPKRLHSVLADVARAKARFEEASRGFKSQLTAELEADSQGPGPHKESRFLAAESGTEAERSGSFGATTRCEKRSVVNNEPGGVPRNQRPVLSILHLRGDPRFEFHTEYGGCGPRDAHLAATPGDRERTKGIFNALSFMLVFPPLSSISRSVEATLEALLRILPESSAPAAVAS